MNDETLEVSQRVRARPETVFGYFTDADKYARWQGTTADIDARPGGVFRVAFGNAGWAVGEFVAVERHRRIVFTWGWEDAGVAPTPDGVRSVAPGSSTVEVLLDPVEDGTLVRLRHSGLPSAQAREIHGVYWPVYLERLGVAIDGGEPGLDPVAAVLKAAT